MHLVVALFALAAGAFAQRGLGGGGSGFATDFVGFGVPYGGCGVPQSWLADDNGSPMPFVALNTFANTAGSAQGLFQDGGNCGRWIRITACENCVHGSDNQWEACIVGSTNGLANYSPDSLTGTVLYGYVADSCGDFNRWCRLTPFHGEGDQAYLQPFISAGLWNNRLVDWEFIDGAPPGWTFSQPAKFGWAQGAYLPYYPSLIVYDTVNGISGVSAKNAAGQFVAATKNGPLGNMYVLPAGAVTGGSVVVQVSDALGASYGTFQVDFPCTGTCATPTKAVASRLTT